MIPKRAISAMLTTVFALALLLSFKTPAAPDLASSTTAGIAVVGQPTPNVGSATAPTAPTTTTAPAATSGSTTGPTAPAATIAPAAAAALVDGTVTGPVVTTRYGDVQVQINISSGVLTDVTALQLPSGDRRTNRISSAAEPILREEALTAQSAQIDLLSGATYTSKGYTKLLQAALDQAAA
ncbi:MAG: FMN-binding protein [Candidatus Limnocylindrales bacterium]